MNKCLNCGRDVKNKYCNSKCRNQHKPTVYIPTIDSINKQKLTTLNKWKIFKVKCSKCQHEIEIKEFNVDEPKKEKYYCSRSCANTRHHSKETKEKIGIKNKGQIPWNKNEDKKITKVCPICKNEFRIHLCHSSRIYCSKECYLNDKHCEYRKNGLGGRREGSGTGKSGWYKEYWCDSSWELAWVIYNIEHNISFERNYKGFEYVFNNKIHKFYPDFKIDNGYIEIKGYIDEKNKCKINQFKGKLKIIDKKNITPYIEYVIKKYGKNFIELYENNPHRSKNNKCLVCGNDCVNLYCSRSCSGKRLR